MKRYCLSLLLLLAGCEEQNLPTIPTQHTAQTSSKTTSTVSAPTQILPQNTALLNQHMQENANVYPRNNVQLAIDQQLKAITHPIQQDLLDIMGTELQSIDTTFNNQRITFQYQVWQIKQNSVCQHANQNAVEFSDCTQAAKQLFQSMCSELQQAKQNQHPRSQQLQRMYCQASVAFKPTIAQISRSQAKEDNKTQALRKNCNDLIFKAKISENSQDEQARDYACKIYKKSANLK